MKGYIQPNVNSQEAQPRGRGAVGMRCLLCCGCGLRHPMTAHLNPPWKACCRPGSSWPCWVGGDATLEIAGALDWKAKRYMREDAKEMLQTTAMGNKVPELSDELEMKIALAELLCFVGLGMVNSSHMPRTTKMRVRG